MEEKKERTLTLYKEQVHFDIDNRSYKFADASLQGAGDKVKNAVMSDVVFDDNDKSLLNRLTDDRDATIRKRLMFCLKEEEIISLDNKPSEEEAYIYNLVLPVTIKDNVLKVVLVKIHEYLVEGALLDWYFESGIASSMSGIEGIINKVNSLEDEIVNALRTPSGDTKRPLQPFGPQYKI